jgi:mono/diheme cytochrome c family protein
MTAGTRLLLGVLLLLLPTRAAIAQEDDFDRPLPGLIATYRLVGSDEPLLTRYEPAPAMLLGPAESPDPRLPAQGWAAQWRGTLEILRPGKHRFAGRASGTLRVRVGSQTVLAMSGGKEEAAGEMVDLKFGLHPLSIDFQPSGPVATLSLAWESDSFGREPLPGYVLGHLRTEPPVENLYAEGRLMVEEHSCTACHRPRQDTPPAASLLTRPGPHLTAAGTRLSAAWIYHWLGDPQALRPEAVMPRMFSDDRRGQIERQAVAAFLASQGQPAASERKLPRDQIKQMEAEGRQLFEQTGCVVCHEKQGEQPARATLQLLGAKTTVDLLSTFIRNPSSIDPAGRMPGFDLSDDQAVKLATYLVYKDRAKTRKLQAPQPPPTDELRELLLGKNPTAEAVLDFNAQTVEECLVSLGRRVIAAKRCTACHELKPTGEDDLVKPKYAAHDFASICAQPAGGCLAAADQPQSQDTPRFGASLSRPAASEFLIKSQTAPGTAAPGEAARLMLARLNCTGCHERDGQGGLSADLIARLLADQTQQNAEMVSPPSLTGVMDKLQTRYLREVLEEHARSRPWMALKMPRFAKEHVSTLVTGLAALEGQPSRANPKRPENNDATLEAGRTLVGAKGFGCTKCHDMLAVASQGTRGPELSFVPRRVNFDWYLRWMTDPQRIQPGTRMPTVFLSGQSPHKEILGGDPQQQRVAVWQYLQRSRSLPPPDGLQPQIVADVADDQRPVVFRTFLPGVTPRSMAVRYPNGVHLIYDAQTCRLASAFHGEFLNLAPVWDGRGGMKAGIKGATFWTSPEGFPWEITAAADTFPDFTGRGKDTALGAELPHDGQLHPTRLHFRGYRTGEAGPTFRYELELDDASTGAFAESIVSLKNGLAMGVLRETAIAAPAGRTVWLNAATADQPPAWRTADGKSGVLDSARRIAPAEAVLTLVQQGQPLVLHLRSASAGADWCVAQRNSKWCLVARLPIGSQGSTARVQLALWKPNAAGSIDDVCQAELNGGGER